MKREIKVVHQPDEANPFLVVYKPHGMPSAPLAKDADGKTDTALSQAIKLFPEIKNVSGILPHEHGLLHRIDNDASGLILIATTQKSFDDIFSAQRDGCFIKNYRAKCNILYENIDILKGFPCFMANAEEDDILNFGTFDDDVYTDSHKHRKFVAISSFRVFGKSGKEVRPVTENSGKAALKKSGNVIYETKIEIFPQTDGNRGKKNTNAVNAVCTIERGFRHQVRCHLAWAGFPVIGDKLYNALYRSCGEEEAGELQFEAFRLEFPHPINKTKVIVEV